MRGVDEVKLSTLVYVSPEEAYEFLVDFEGYANYTNHLSGVRKRSGNGGPGTVYDIRVKWWKLTYTVRSEVTDLVPPERIEWKLVKDLNAHGAWRVEHVPEEAPEGREIASRIFLDIRFDADSADAGMLDLPRFVSLGWVVDRVKPVVLAEAERVVERIVADLEGERRPVDLTIHERPGAGESEEK